MRFLTIKLRNASLVLGALCLMISSFASATVIEAGYQQGFTGWYDASNWVIEGEGSATITDDHLYMDATEGSVLAKIMMPNTDLVDVAAMLYATVTFNTPFDAVIYRDGDDDWVRMGTHLNAETYFTPGEWFGIELRTGALTVTDFTAPYVADGPTASVPEPGALALLALGIVGLGTSQMRRKRNA